MSTTVDVVVIGKGGAYGAGSLLDREPPVTKAVEVSPGIQLGAVLPDVAHVVLHACKFRNLRRNGDQALYGFARVTPPGQTWDSDNEISKALFLSHFIHPHEGGLEFAARIQVDDRNRVVDITPADILPCYLRAYPSQAVRRRWLTQEDANELPALIRSYDDSRQFLTDKRLGMAVSLFSESHFIFQGRPRVVTLAGILEGLVSTKPERALKQFVVRVPALAAEVGLPEFDRKWADGIYKLRSKLAHGSPIFETQDDAERQAVVNDVNAAMHQMDQLLRRIVKRSLLDRQFAERVDNVDTHWPVTGKGCASCRLEDDTLIEVFCPRCGKPWRLSSQNTEGRRG